MSVSMALSIFLRELSLRRPDVVAFDTGTRSVIRLRSKEMTNSFSLCPAISWISILTTLPTPWVG